MSYLEEFQNQINKKDFHKFFQLWEEFCTNEKVDAEEFLSLTKLIKKSEFDKTFGQFVETALLIWETVEDDDYSYEIMKNLIDLQTTDSEVLADTSYRLLEKKYGDDAHFKDRIKKIGLRTKSNFKGAISNYELLNHLEKGKFVFHKGGWGTGEVMDVSPLREQVAIEFENVPGIKHFTFENAFKMLKPIGDDHFLSRRFGHPDLFEEFAKKDHVEVIKILLRDLGPKNAKEIKDELCDLVIPDQDWSRWWQNARSKLKKDSMIENPKTLRDSFKIRKVEITHEEALTNVMKEKEDLSDIIRASYSFVRDLPHMFRKKEVKNSIKDKLLGLLSRRELNPSQEIQIYIFLESLFAHRVEGKTLKEFIKNIDNIEEIINKIDIVAFKKRALMMVREYRLDWTKVFFSMLFTVDKNPIRDYIFKQLDEKDTTEQLTKELKNLIIHPEKHPETFFWYFQKIIKNTSGELPFSEKEGRCKFIDAFLVLLHKIELKTKYRDLAKKMYNLLIDKRFLVVRNFIEGTDIDFLKEFLLLVSKCHTFSDHDRSIMRSLAYVVQPTLGPKKNSSHNMYDSETVWTTEEGYIKTADRIKYIATHEMVENAKEVEVARAHGDLRENAEYKFACERRARFQGEMKMLSKLINKARIITQEDIYIDVAGVGNRVILEDQDGKRITYTILGPWDTDPEKNIISYQSKLAKAIAGKKVGSKFEFLNIAYKIVELKSFLD